jgi:hypothetical protein
MDAKPDLHHTQYLNFIKNKIITATFSVSRNCHHSDIFGVMREVHQVQAFLIGWGTVLGLQYMHVITAWETTGTRILWAMRDWASCESVPAQSYISLTLF